MLSKYTAWVLGVVLVLVLGVVAFFWRSHDKAVLAPVAQNEVKEVPSDQTSQNQAVAPTPADTTTDAAPSAKASLDDISKSIGADASNDKAALNKDASAEMGSLEEGNATINDLGQTYDESKY